MSDHFKACGCGRSFTREEWGQLDYLGPMDDGVQIWEYRNCTCGSTLAVAVGASPESKPIDGGCP